ncbi:hypothetical protein [Hymenobacter canadensis]|uniref:Lipocalin-like domain-containing protein n=1 Tax=Hymenobacter canadensis TaxID=2999067 RepID=A0ABY7LU15_9BACT|nr:hypothetical protein [Hymenobacter canadensis]WBA43422.1 hypothetical protein O3303_07600 [Hymenobacter canadensis]
MKKVTLFLSLAATVLSLASCEKELDNVNTPNQAVTASAATAAQTVEEKTSLLTTGDWKLTSQVGTANELTTDLRVMLKADKLDNLTQFRDAGKLILDEGTLKRDAETTQQTEGTWAFTDNGQSLAMAHAGVTTTYSIAELTATTLRLVQTEAGAGGKTTTITSVYGR